MSTLKNLARTSAAVFALTLFALPAISPTPAPAQGIREGKMRILGRATVEAVPDYVTVLVGISNRAASPTVALDQNSAVARKIINFSKSFGVGERDIQTQSVNLTPAFKTVRDPNGTTRAVVLSGRPERARRGAPEHGGRRSTSSHTPHTHGRVWGGPGDEVRPHRSGCGIGRCDRRGPTA